MRIPRKKELLELQKKYRTDKRIAEVYGVPTRLVTYWRSKKKIGSYSFPKYTEDKIQELWERFGDDGRAGDELGISKAGFRQWRRKYNINQRPRQLKLEQLELALIDGNHRKNSRHETIIEKILAKRSGLRKVDIGDVVNVDPDLLISFDNTGEIIRYFNDIGDGRLCDPEKCVIALDYKSPKGDSNKSYSHKAIREFIRKRKFKNFYDIGQGIPQQVVLENGHVLPGQLILASDNQASTFGCVGAFSIAITPMEMAAAWASGRLWLRVPETVKININGRLMRGVYARDAILKIVRDLKSDSINYKAVEIHGSAVASMSVSERFTLTSMFTEIGAKSAVVPYDDVTGRFLKRMIKTKYTPVMADSDASYCAEIDLDINYLTPQVACSSENGMVQSIEEVAGKKIDQVVLGGCVNGRIDDLETAVRILRGRRIARDIRMFVIPASRNVYSEALERGYIRTFIDSGCDILSPSCGSCLKANQETLEPGEKALTTGADCCKGKNSISGGEIYLGSPATAAATALEGAIADPRKYVK